ncbi:MAG: DUF4435 domain-containing protein [Chitinophagaceae bacterium]|nr:DUF4435 domain-containing protein [Chitinophagaceae bacterium]
MSVDALRESRGLATVILTKFMTLKEYHSKSIFCGFEGTDAKYYLNKIENETGVTIDRIVPFSCQGKHQVLRLHRLITQRDEYSSVKFAYFIDSDFDLPVQNENIYETPCYSVENFYSSINVFKRILKAEFAYNETDNEYNFLVDNFIKRQSEFHQKTLLFNAWLACQRDLSNANPEIGRVDVTDFSIGTFIKDISIDEIVCDEYSLDKIASLFPDAPILDKKVIQNKVEELNKQNLQKILRGKYEIDFLYGFIHSVLKEYKVKNPRCVKVEGSKVNPSKNNILSEYSHYADKTDCLIEYLSKYKV